MRPIKFRAFDTKVDQPMWDTEGCFSLLMLQHRVSIGVADDEGRLDRFIIMQYTGLLDKNGVEVYEGDLLSHTDTEVDYIAKVGWSSYDAQFELIDVHDGMSRQMLKDELEDFEVIGNIYQNPELLTP